MICTPPSTAGPSSHRTQMSHPANTHSCASASTAAAAAAAIFPFPGPAPALHQREMYLRALEQEREEILAAAYAAKRSRSNSPTTPFPEGRVHDVNYDDNDDEDESADEDEDDRMRFDERGRQLTFRETVRQRQARLEFLRRQEFARRLAHRGLEDAKASAYAIKRLPPPRARPIERVNAAITIQRAYRVHRAVAGLNALTQRVRAAHERFIRESRSEKDYDAAWRAHADALHALLRELGERTGVLAGECASASALASTKMRTGTGSQAQALHPRVRAAARTAMEALRAELAQLDRAQVSRHYSPLLAPSSAREQDEWSSSSSSSDSEFDEGEDDSEFDDDEDEDEDYSSYTYTPSPPALTTSLYVVDEEDEDELEDEEVSPNMRHLVESTAKGRWVGEQEQAAKASGHQRSRHAPLSVSTPVPTPISAYAPIVPGVPGPRSPVARSPSLASIPEEVDVEC